ncbi:hypothetical protein F8568_042625 [Actinomadura sp. LD22]|uniref:Nuclear transport factor 2 family protein n=1 Tax=Actinomadura physcomitrii TaxID=2650748 RepID=A0A6I4MX21_9ACTN|nr:nuclear transport factor 2 family protein [Actinomadura physcomitrii]MWA06926.1 hypothetical protein [Actinomadura physcomitrii]
MTQSTGYELRPATIEDIARRYVAVWSEPDAGERRAAIAALWAEDGVEFVEGARFRGHDELEARIAEAYDEFVVRREYAVVSEGDVFGHHDAVTFTVRLETSGGDVAWAARVFLVVGEDDLIRYDYQFTVQPLQA